MKVRLIFAINTWRCGRTCFRFCGLRITGGAQRFAELEPAISKATRVLAVGDLHLENFGTWRDAIGRLAWGINDFDEAYPLPYTNDLVRLATSRAGGDRRGASSADAEEPRARPSWREYRQGWTPVAGRLLLARIIVVVQADFCRVLCAIPGMFWDKLGELPRERMAMPEAARSAIEKILPNPELAYELRHHQVGLGNLGKPRFTAIAQWHGGPVAREAKALTLSVAAWAKEKPDGPYYAPILSNAIRSCDPFLQVHGKWIARRISPDSRRLELESLSGADDKELLLHAMGFETANVHLGTSRARRMIGKHLAEFSSKTLRLAATTMQKTLEKDFRRWRKG